MQVKRENLSETKVKLEISLGVEEISHAKQHELQEYAKTVKVAGFRPGKAPLTVVEKQVDDTQLQANSINHAINDFYEQALNGQKIRPLSQPAIKVIKFVPYTELLFEAEVEIMPAITLGDYHKIKKTLPKVTVTAKEIEDVLKNLTTRSAVKAGSDKSAKDGDDVLIDFEGTDSKSKTVAGASGSNYRLNLGSNSFIPGFEKGLVGLKVGDEKDLALSFPKEYHAKNLAGTKINFHVKVLGVETSTLPVLDDAFAASISSFKTLAELKQDVKSQLIEQKTSEETNKVKDEILEELVKKSKISLPEVLVNDQITSLEQDFDQNLLYRGMTKVEYLDQQGFKDEAEWKEKELKAQAERRVAVGMILAEVAEKEGLSVSDADVAERVTVYKQQYQQSADQFDTPEMKREVGMRLITERTVGLLFTIATKK